MEWRAFKLAIFVACLGLSLTQCSKSQDTEGSIPTPEAPATDPNTSLPTPSDAIDSRLPSWVSKAVPVQLTTARDYSNLESLFGVVYPPLVGDPLVAMDLFGNRESSVTGTVHLGFEDTKGFDYISIPSVPGVGSRTSNSFNGYFSDSAGVVRVVGTLSNNTLAAQFYFRNRSTSDAYPACQTYLRCVQWDWYGNCQQDVQEVDVVACQNYMNPSQSQVKLLGTFSAQYLNWFSK